MSGHWLGLIMSVYAVGGLGLFVFALMGANRSQPDDGAP